MLKRCTRVGANASGAHAPAPAGGDVSQLQQLQSYIREPTTHQPFKLLSPPHEDILLKLSLAQDYPVNTIPKPRYGTLASSPVHLHIAHGLPCQH